MSVNTAYLIESSVIDPVLRDALAISGVKIRLDELDCSKSFHRQSTTISLEEIVAMAKRAAVQWTLIYRPEFGREPAYYELGCRVSSPGSGVDYFAWIECPFASGRRLIARHRLSPTH